MLTNHYMAKSCLIRAFNLSTFGSLVWKKFQKRNKYCIQIVMNRSCKVVRRTIYSKPNTFASRKIVPRTRSQTMNLSGRWVWPSLTTTILPVKVNIYHEKECFLCSHCFSVVGRSLAHRSEKSVKIYFHFFIERIAWRIAVFLTFPFSRKWCSVSLTENFI